VLPEWQGYGVSDEPARGARLLASALFSDRDALTIEAPARESLVVRDQVLGLDSIAPRAVHTAAVIRQRQPDRIFTVGATYGVELGPIGYLNNRYGGDLAVLWLDAHADLNTPASSPSGHFHGMVLRSLLGDGPSAIVGAIACPLTAAQTVLVGARDLDPPEAAFASAAGVALVATDDTADPAPLVALIRARGFGHVYVHFDLDILNPQDFGSSLMRAPGGPTLSSVERLITSICDTFTVVGASVVEYCERNASDRERICGVVRRSGLFRA